MAEPRYQIVKDVKRGRFVVRRLVSYGYEKVAVFSSLEDALLAYPPHVDPEERVLGVHWDSYHQSWTAYSGWGRKRVFLGRDKSKAKAVVLRKIFEMKVGYLPQPSKGGVCWHPKRNSWSARLSINGYRKHLGYGKTREQAEALVKEARDVRAAVLKQEISREPRTLVCRVLRFSERQNLTLCNQASLLNHTPLTLKPSWLMRLGYRTHPTRTTQSTSAYWSTASGMATGQSSSMPT